MRRNVTTLSWSYSFKAPLTGSPTLLMVLVTVLEADAVGGRANLMTAGFP